MTRIVAAILILLALSIAAPRSAALPVSPPDGHPIGASSDSHVAGRVAGITPPGGAPPTATRYRGTATHYCLPGQRGTPYCTRGYGPDDLVAAIDTDLGFDKGDVVLVRSLAGPEEVVVTIVDVCGCPGDRLIDLTSSAFRRLAPLGIGVIPVSIEMAGAERTLPPTDEED